jgi:hypothetical protein
MNKIKIVFTLVIVVFLFNNFLYAQKPIQGELSYSYISDSTQLGNNIPENSYTTCNLSFNEAGKRFNLTADLNPRNRIFKFDYKGEYFKMALGNINPSFSDLSIGSGRLEGLEIGTAGKILNISVVGARINPPDLQKNIYGRYLSGLRLGLNFGLGEGYSLGIAGEGAGLFDLITTLPEEKRTAAPTLNLTGGIETSFKFPRGNIRIGYGENYYDADTRDQSQSPTKSKKYTVTSGFLIEKFDFNFGYRRIEPQYASYSSACTGNDTESYSVGISRPVAKFLSLNGQYSVSYDNLNKTKLFTTNKNNLSLNSNFRLEKFSSNLGFGYSLTSSNPEGYLKDNTITTTISGQFSSLTWGKFIFGVGANYMVSQYKDTRNILPDYNSCNSNIFININYGTRILSSFNYGLNNLTYSNNKKTEGENFSTSLNTIVIPGIISIGVNYSFNKSDYSEFSKAQYTTIGAELSINPLKYWSINVGYRSNSSNKVSSNQFVFISRFYF